VQKRNLEPRTLPPHLGERSQIVVVGCRLHARGLQCGSIRRSASCAPDADADIILLGSYERELVIDTFRWGAHGINLLTDREEEVVRLVAGRTTNREASVRLGLNGHTVRNSLQRIFDEVGVSKGVELTLSHLQER
jgi:DNA-binding CsgD family transcriptional regulator